MFKNENSNFGNGGGGYTEGDRKKLDTFGEVTYMVKLAADPKVYSREDKSLDVVLTFCDSSRFDNHLDLWVDARVLRGQQDRARKFRKGDMVQIVGKLRFKKQNDGGVRGKIFDARISSFQNTSDRTEIEPTEPSERTFE